MSRRPIETAAIAAVVVLLLSGCAGRTAAPATSAPLRITPTPTPLVTPSAQPDEIARAVFADATAVDGAGALPAAGQVAVEVACSGADGSALTWRLTTGAGVSLGLSGTADCSAPPTTSWLGITAEPRPTRVRIALEAGAGVTAGWAIVTAGTP